MKKLKFGILGGSRGMDFLHRVLKNHPFAEVTAICEKYGALKEKIEREFPNVSVFAEFDDFLQEDLDAVIIANYANRHAEFAIRAFNRGLHVLSESLPTQTMGEAVRLCEAVEQSGKIYAYGENYCYLPHVFEMRKLLESGELGEVMHAEGNFINDCSMKWHLLTRGDRNHWRNHVPSTFYCTHSIGPLLFVSGRRAVTVVGMETQRMPHMAKSGARSASAAMEIMQLDNGGMAKSCNGNFRRDYTADYRFILEHGTVESDLNRFGELRVILADEAKKCYTYDNRFPSTMEKAIIGIDALHEEDPFKLADIYCINIFIQSILGNEEAKKYLIDVYRALDMSTPGLLAYRSILKGSQPMEVVDFRNKAERAVWKDDNKSTDPQLSFGEDLLPPNRNGFPQVEDAVYEQVKQAFLETPMQSGGR